MVRLNLLGMFALVSGGNAEHRRFLAQREEGNRCPPINQLIEIINAKPKLHLTGASTDNAPGTYGSNQVALDSSHHHCYVQYNNYTKSDFVQAIDYLSCELEAILANPVVSSAFTAAIQGLSKIVENADNPPKLENNKWIGATTHDFVAFFKASFWFLPKPNNGLKYILEENYFERNNPAAIYFLNNLKSQTPPATEPTTEVFDWTYRWVTLRGMFMDSNSSLDYLGDWTDYIRNTSSNTNAPPSAYAFPDHQTEYKSFNQFFSRSFVNVSASRPISQPQADEVVTAPGDVEINMIIAKLQNDTKIPVKGIHKMNVQELLNGSEHASRFIGGTAISCVLMPYAYHRFHSPVTGDLVEAVDVPGYLFGIPGGKVWFGSGNTGTGTANFNIFGGFHRSYYIYDTPYGYVAQIAVGLADVSSMCPSVNSDHWIAPGSNDRIPMKKGDPVGYFAYGGSLNILLFEPGVMSSMNVLMGERLGAMQKVVRK
jgi:phosphatidylserine decarboxylase